MNVLSLFDGMGGAYQAMVRAKILVDNYYFSEVDKNCVKVSLYNNPDGVNLGDIKDYKEWGVDWGKIDILFGGFPCQAYSFGGKQKAFDDPRGQLAIITCEILEHAKKQNPNLYFLLENVKMKKVYSDKLNEIFGVKFISINSNLVSAQNRTRYYWTNIPNVVQPEDRGITFSNGIIAAIRGRVKNEEGKGIEKEFKSLKGICKQYLEPRRDGKSNALNTIMKTNVVIEELPETLPILAKDFSYRHLTIDELCFLQTLDPNMFKDERGELIVSKTAIQKMIGNGWTIDVIVEILKNITYEK